MPKLRTHNPKIIPSTAAHGQSNYQSPALLNFVTEILGREDEMLRQIREEIPGKGIPAINIGPEEGRILNFLAHAIGARKIVEVGTLAGYSGAWLARALPKGGILHTLEFNPLHAKVARENFGRLGLTNKATIHEGAALDILPTLNSKGPFDLCFIDADKVNYSNYARWAVENVRAGGLVIGDNAYLFGKLHLKPEKAGQDAPSVKAMADFLKILANPKLFSSCAMLPTGEGMAVAVRK